MRKAPQKYELNLEIVLQHLWLKKIAKLVAIDRMGIISDIAWCCRILNPLSDFRPLVMSSPDS